MRNFLNAILSFIGASSLTDDEFASLDGVVTTQTYDQNLYLALLTILIDRNSVSGTRDRLKYFFLARGIEIVAAGETGETSRDSNILVGRVLTCE